MLLVLFTVTMQKRNTFFILILTAFGALLFNTACNKDEFNSDPKFELSFSSDTVIFDTVFTTIGSVTQAFVVKNTSKSKILISDISLARGKSSPFRINIDGEATETVQNLEIGAKDSAYIFVKVTIDPNNTDNPLIETDSVVFTINGNKQNVKLVAWGQDAYFHHNEVLSGEVLLLANKPHVIYGDLTAGNNCKLTIPAGSKLYFHNAGRFTVMPGASLNVEGTLESPVIFTSDRLDDDYLNVPGLWEGIWLQNKSQNNSFTFAEITNASIGLQADSCGFNDGIGLKLHNCLIHNMTNYGLRATLSKITATNCQFTNCGGNVVSIENGGEYDFRNCTLARYFNGRGYPALSINNFAYDTSGTVKLATDLTKAYFGNCIITGSQNNEIVPEKSPEAAFEFFFDQCLVNWDASLFSKTDFDTHFVNCIKNEDVNFVNKELNNFSLDTLSFAIDAASIAIINEAETDIALDRKGISRLSDENPDLGAYERVEIRKK